MLSGSLQLGGYQIGAFYIPKWLRIMELMPQVIPTRASIRNHWLLWLFGLLSTVYLTLIYFTNPAELIFPNLDISTQASRWLSIGIRLPLIVIWFVTLYGYLRMSAYTNYISGKDGGFRSIRQGLLVFAVGLPITYIVSNFWTLLYQHDIVSRAVTAVSSNYLQLAIMAVGILLVARGAFQLTRTIARQPVLRYTAAMILFGVLIGASYCFLVANNLNNPELAPSANNLWHYVPAVVVIFTFVVPYLFIWSLASRSIYEIARYQQYVKGKLYRSAVQYLTAGISVVIAMNILYQFIITLSRQSFNLTNATMFFVAYAIYIGVGIGFLLIARGARRLQHIEEA